MKSPAPIQSTEAPTFKEWGFSTLLVLGLTLLNLILMFCFVPKFQSMYAIAYPGRLPPDLTEFILNRHISVAAANVFILILCLAATSWKWQHSSLLAYFLSLINFLQFSVTIFALVVPITGFIEYRMS